MLFFLSYRLLLNIFSCFYFLSEQVEWYTLERGETLNIYIFLDSTQFNLNYFQEGDPEATLLIRKGREMYDDPTQNRLEMWERGFRFQMLNLENQDSGKFELRDQDNNLALVVRLNVKRKWQNRFTCCVKDTSSFCPVIYIHTQNHVF